MDIYAVNATVEIYFTTNAGTGAAVAPLSAYEAADVTVYKNHSATQRTSQSGWTMTSPFDSIVGLHQLSIDLSDNTDAGFWATGNIYTLVLNADTETVDSQVVVAVIGQFKIGQVDANLISVAGTTQTAKDLGLALPAAAPNAAGGLLITTAGSLDMDDIGADVEEIINTLATEATNLAEANADLDELITTIGAAGAGLTALPTAAAIVTAMAAHVVEGTITWDQCMKILLASQAGKVSGAAGTTVKIRDTADSLDRITATVDTHGDRTAVTLNLA